MDQAPVFVKGDIAFRVGQTKIGYSRKSISVFGVNGLSWLPLNPNEHFGMKVDTTIHFPQIQVFTVQTAARIIRERTAVSDYMGLRFQFDPGAEVRFREFVKRRGHVPADYMRKYPRIHSTPFIQTFPLCVTVQENRENGQQIVMDLANLSPQGVLLKSENQNSLLFNPGQRLSLTLEPRGWFPIPVKVQGQICRVIDDIDDQTGNLIRHFGIAFTSFDELNKAAFLDLLKDILFKIQGAQAPLATTKLQVVGRR